MDQADVKAAVGKPHMLRLKQIGGGLKVGKILGSRVLVKTVTPRTEMDRVEEQGLIHLPKWVKKENTPLPTTGVVLLVGPNIPCSLCGQGEQSHLSGDPCVMFLPSVNEGDMVMFPKFSGSDIQVEEEDLRIVEAKEILCTLVDTMESLTEVKNEA